MLRKRSIFSFQCLLFNFANAIDILDEMRYISATLPYPYGNPINTVDEVRIRVASISYSPRTKRRHRHII